MSICPGKRHKAKGIRQRAKGKRGRMIRNYRDLIVWQKGMSLVTKVYSCVKLLPDDELYGLSSQIRRSAVSIPSNIAEGYGRGKTKDYLRYLRISRGSLYELQTQLEISVNLKFLGQNIVADIYDDSKEVERMLNALISKVEKSEPK